MRIGVFDSGLGGLTVLKELHRVLPSAEYFYLGDTARSPYGPKSAETILTYAVECAHFLEQFNPDCLVVACNTASALALDSLRGIFTKPLVGTIEPAIQACLPLQPGRPVAVIGTKATIRSKAYCSALMSLDSQLEVLSIACPLFVPLVEEGIFSGEIVSRVIDMYLSPLKEGKPQALILGCTHYPLLGAALADYLGEDTRIIECSRAIADQVAATFPNVGDCREEGRTSYFVTDEVDRFNALATLLLGGAQVQAVHVGVS